MAKRLLKFRLTTLFSMGLVVLLLAEVHAKSWNPRPGWRDSYAVGEVCYCDSSNYDHGIGSKLVIAPDGYERSVRQVCHDIREVFGEGPRRGRIPYNTIACGHGPANDAADEHLKTGCPGRVDKGVDGCFEIGPDWPLDKVYNERIEVIDSARWRFDSSHNVMALGKLIDNNPLTRWSTNQPQQAGQWIEIDMGTVQAFNRIELLTTRSPQDYPRSVTLESSVDRKQWESVVKVNPDTARPNELTRIKFPVQLSRYIRLSQSARDKQYYWSVHELKIGMGL